ncbi:MAG: DUF3843 family protein, partial [Bacteroidales bacterium]|nr:DUF3843 family protein [Bacteroidales bacterium]
WLKFHPNNKPQKTDMHYLKVCNMVNEVFNEFGHELFRDDVEENGKQLSCLLVAWFEDLVSEAGIWQAFINRHHQLYNKYLPFYDLDKYFDGEPNPQDITFLIWYYLSMKYQHRLLISPVSELLILVANLIFDIFDEEWDDAPVNRMMHDFLMLPHDQTDFYKIRSVIEWLMLNSYLFYFYGEQNEKEKIYVINELRKKGNDIRRFEGLIFGLHDDKVQNTITSLLAMKGKDWLAQILGEKHPLHTQLLGISEKKTGSFLYLGHDTENIHVKHISSGKLINVTLKSLEPANLIPDKSVLTFSIVNWQNEWWFSGSLFTQDYDDEVLLEETSNPTNAGLFDNEDSKKEIILEQYQHFLEFNNQKPIKYFENRNAMHDFLVNFFDFYNEKKSEKTGKKTPLLKNFEQNRDLKETTNNFEEDALVFFNRDIGMEVVFGFNSIVPDPENQFYINTTNNKDAMKFYYGNIVSKDLVLYLSEINCLPYFKFPGTETDELVRENLDFLLRFFKPESFHAKAQITLLK